MYTSSHLIIYTEKGIELKDTIHSLIAEYNIAFKELNSIPLVFSAIKNPQNHIILFVKSVGFLKNIENIVRDCHNYQDRIFIIHLSTDTIDYFFDNYCLHNNLNPLKEFIQQIIKSNKVEPQHHTSKLLQTLVTLELKNLDISTKYIGFKYLTSVLVNALSNNFYSNNYIDLFEYAASTNLATIDTIERDVRHMLLTTWKKSEKFRQSLESHSQKIDKPNAKNLLTAIITYLKNII